MSISNNINDDKPISIQGDLRHLPRALEPLIERPNWVLWRWEKNEKGNDWTKVPYRPNGKKASSNDPNTWSTFKDVIKALDGFDDFDGIGFCLDNDIAAFDIDKCRDPDTKVIHPWAARLVADAKSYVEITVSGTGLRIIGFAQGKPVSRKQPVEDDVSLETYRRPKGRYIIVTGNPLPESASELANIDVQIDATVAELDAKADAARRSSRKSAGSGFSTSKPIPPKLAVMLSAVKVDPYPTRSELMFLFITEALRAGVADETIVEACVDATHRGCAIFEHCQENGGAPYVETQIERAKDKIGQGLEAGVAEINDQYALVLAGNKAAIMKFEVESKTKFRLLQVGAFKQWYANQLVPVIGQKGTKMTSIADYWLSHHNRRQYAGIEFRPTAPRSDHYNLWQGFAFAPEAGDCSKFLAHLRDNVARGDYQLYLWIEAWFASIFQKPSEKFGTALALRGKQGVGKTIVGRVFGKPLGAHYSLVADPRYVTGQFNSHMAALLLLQADEAFWAGDKRSEGKWKDLITGGTHYLEFKGVEPILVDNFVRVLVTGNQDWIVPAGFDERRFAVIDVGETHKEDHPYFAAIEEQMNNGGYQALLYHLLNVDISKVNLKSVPRTEALLEQKFASATLEQGWWLETLRNGMLPKGTDDPDTCIKSVLFDRYIKYADRQKINRRSIDTMIGMFLNKYVGPGLETKKLEYEIRLLHGKTVKKRGNGYRFPPLVECRRRFAQNLQQDIVWEDPEQDWQHDDEFIRELPDETPF
jgi:Family of unknown function (DUF5906)